MREIGLNKRATDLRRRRAGAGGRRAKARGANTAAAGLEANTQTGTRGGSGLARATRVREELRARQADAASVSGISADDRKEIQDEIDQISRRNRMSSRPVDFVVRPSRKGFMFPLVVNLLAVAATIGAVLLLSIVFRQREIAIASSSASLDTAEGKLLQELKRDSDTKLQEKDKAIADIRTRMVSLDQERNDLASNIDQKVKSREAELRLKFQAELDAEKKRLADQGLSSNALEARIKSFETEKTGVLDRQLAEARKGAEVEKAAAEEKFRTLREEYQKSISGLGEERRRIQDESRKREEALKASLETKTRELESQSAAAKASLDKARQELVSLEEQKSRAKAEEDRVLGLYGSIRAALRDRRYSDAADGASSLASYLRDPGTQVDAAAQSRRDADIFVAETIGVYARSELGRASADSGKLLAQADLLTAAREAAVAAQAALRAGNASLAASKYREALGKVPEILAAHQYFLDQLQATEAQRRSRLDESLSAADRAFRAGDQAVASARYSEALAYLPIADAARNVLVLRLGQMAVDESGKGAQAADSKAARPLLAAASGRLDAKDWSAAISGYIGLLAAYPATDQAGDALKGIEAASAGMQKSAETAEQNSALAAVEARRQLSDAQARIDRAVAEAAQAAAARDQLAASRDQLVAARDQLLTARDQTNATNAQAAAASKATEAALRADIESLRKQLSETQAKTAQTAAAANPALDTAAQAALSGEITKLKAEVQRLTDESARNQAGSAKYEALAASYGNYLASEGEALKKGGKDSGLAAQSSLYAFLGEGVVVEAFPGLKEKVASFQGASQSELLDAFPSDASEIVQQALAFKDKAALNAYYASKRDVYQKSGNKLMVNFLDAVSKVLN